MSSIGGDSIHVSIKFPVKVSLFVLVIGIGLILLYYFTTKSTENTLIFAAATSAAAGAILAAFYTARTLSLQLQQEINANAAAIKAHKLKQKENAMDLASRWTDPQMQAARRTCRQIADLKGQSLTSIQGVVDSEEKKTHIFHLLNYLEEVATSIEYEISDSEVMKEFYCEVVTTVWVTLELWVKYYRREHDLMNAWTMLEKLHKDWTD